MRFEALSFGVLTHHLKVMNDHFTCDLLDGESALQMKRIKSHFECWGIKFEIKLVALQQLRLSLNFHRHNDIQIIIIMV